MSDEKKDADNQAPRRPNAAYNLSGKTQADGELVFRYSRAERLSRSPQAVRDLYDEKKKAKFSLLRPLIGGKGRAVMFGSIVLICAALMVLTLFDPGAYALDGNTVEVSALRFEGTIIVSVTKTAQKNAAAYTGAVDIGASAASRSAGEIDESPPDFLHRVFFTGEPVEEYRFSVPFEGDALLLVLQTETESVSMKVEVQ